MRVDVSAKIIRFPRVCACCTCPADTEIAVSASRSSGERVVRTRTKTWAFPYCQGCLAHVAVWSSGGSRAAAIYAVGLALALIVGLAASGLAALGTLIAMVISAELLRSHRHKRAEGMCSHACAAASEAVAYLGWSGTVQSFQILSEKYAAAFLVSNEQKLVNVD